MRLGVTVNEARVLKVAAAAATQALNQGLVLELDSSKRHEGVNRSGKVYQMPNRQSFVSPEETSHQVSSRRRSPEPG